MYQIEQIDPHFAVLDTAGEVSLLFRDARSGLFRLYGLMYNPEAEQYQRMPADVAKAVNPGVAKLYRNTSGGRLRLRTNSRYICLRVEYDSVSRMSHMPLTGQAGFDLYERVDGNWEYAKTFVPPKDVETGFESLYTRQSAEMRDICIHFPLYNGVKKVELGCDPEAEFESPQPYRVENPVVYYGSSITQGGCASRPGNSFSAILSRELDCDHVNLGFSGTGKAEPIMAEYIASLPLSVLVMTCFYNTPLPVYKERYEAFYQLFRRLRPEIPVIFYTAPLFSVYEQNEDVLQRISIVEHTYQNAVQKGDKKVWYIDGRRVREIVGCDGTVDNDHPNDLGFWAMAKVLKESIAQALWEN